MQMLAVMIKGKVNVNELLFLKSSANIQGDIVTGSLSWK
jgi:hypothetical protein